VSRLATFILVAALLLGADSSWTRVKDLKGRSELRVYKKGAREPINATFEDANDDRIIVVVRNEEVAIPKADIDRIDARPMKAPRKLTVDSTTKQTDPDPVPHPNPTAPVPGASSSSTISVGDSRPNFETIYRRPEGAAKN
jgi:hypothetical protein